MQWFFADGSFLTLFDVVVFDVFLMVVSWAGYFSFCFCTRPFVFASFAHDRQMVMACQMDGSWCGLNDRI